MSRYALRAAGAHDRRSGGRRPSSGLLGTGDGLGNASVDAEVAALAALDAGLLPHSLSKEEMRRFATVGPSEYLEARSLVLSRWASDPTAELTSRDCVDAARASDPSLPADKVELVREAHRYLSLIGAINFGLISRRGEGGERPRASSTPAAAPSSAAPPAGPSDADLLSALAAELAAADMGSATEKALRRRLEAAFGGVDLTERKPLLRAGVERFLAGEAVVVVPGGEEEVEGEEREEEGEPPLCRPGASAVVVGAGPAGLGAALHLARCGVRVTVLEARGRAGGRAHSVAARVGEARSPAPGLAAVADLGASIVTGVAPDFSGDAALSASATAGRRSDPSSLLARQLGVSLHRLGESLPLFDPSPPPSSAAAPGAGGGESGGGGGSSAARQVPKEADERADIMRDALLDDAKDAAFHSASREQKTTFEGGAGASSGEKGRTLGEFLEASLAARLSAAASAASAAAKKEEQTPGGGEDSAAAAAAAEGDGDEAAARERAAFSLATATELKLLDWHWANLEYGCAAPLSKVCLSHWNQDDTFGGFGGGHAMVVGGYGALLERAAERLSASFSSSPPASSSDASNGGGGVDLRFSTPVRSIRWGSGGDEGSGSGEDERSGSVVVTTASGEQVEADVAIVTVPLGVLKDSVSLSSSPSPSSPSPATISFEPPLPPWKADAVRALGFGKLEKVFLEFGAGAQRFWPEGLDFFGVLQPTAASSTEAENRGNGGGPSHSPPPSLLLSRDPTAAELTRGSAFMFWDVGRFQPGSPPVLAALFSGAAAERFLGGSGSGSESGGGGGDGDGEAASSSAAAAAAALQAALSSLRSVFGEGAVPDPVASLTTSWGSDPFAGRGAYSFVAPGASGATYDLLARPCGRRLLFAGEHTARRHPDTVGGALLSGVREAARALGWGGVLGNAAVDGEEAIRKRRQRLKKKNEATGRGGEGGGGEGSSSSSSSGEDDSSSTSSDDDDDEEERNERRREAAEAALARKERRPKKTEAGSDTRARKEKKKKRRRREQPRREAAARASSPPDFGDGGYARTAEQAELDARAAAAERADARSLWTALAAAASGSDPRARAAAQALSAADAAPHRRAVALRCLTTADERSLAVLARNPAIVKALSGWTEEAARASAGASSSLSSSAGVSAAAVAADGARVLGSLPLPAAERGPSGAERAVRAVAAQCKDEGARAAAGAVLDFWFGKGRKEQQQQQQQPQREARGAASGAVEAAAASEKRPESVPPVISDDALPPELRARLLEAERAAAEAAEHAAAAERIEAQLGAARRAAAAASATTKTATAGAAAVAAPVVADIGDFDAYMAARAKEEAKRRGLKRRKDAAAAALAAAEAEEEEEEARERKQEEDGEEGPAAKKAASAPAPSSDGAAAATALLLQEITTAVRACVSTALKRRLKQKKETLSKEQYDGVARKAAAKIVEAEMRKRAEAATSASSSSGFHLSDSKQEKIAKLVEGYVKAAAAAGR